MIGYMVVSKVEAKLLSPETSLHEQTVAKTPMLWRIKETLKPVHSVSARRICSVAQRAPEPTKVRLGCR